MRQTFRFPSAKPQQISKNERPFSKHHHAADQRGAVCDPDLAGRQAEARSHRDHRRFSSHRRRQFKARLTDLKLPLNALLCVPNQIRIQFSGIGSPKAV
ncbi:MAG: hypothetical protein Q4F00_13175 [bacterium]|nr:hypothetical protein [bacterium]